MPTRRSSLALLALAALVAVAGSAAVLGSGGRAAAAPGDPPPDAGVEVEGVGTASAVPDVLRFTVGVESTERAVGEALAASSAAADRVLAALRDGGVAERDVRTASVQIYPQFDRDGQQVTGYVARQDLTVTVRRIADAGAVIGAAVEAGGDAARLQGVGYELDDDADAQAEARKAAFEDARRKAEQYAELTGRSLGEVVSVRERVHASGPGPVVMADSVGMESAAVPIAPGSSEVVVSVEVRWSLT